MLGTRMLSRTRVPLGFLTPQLAHLKASSAFRVAAPMVQVPNRGFRKNRRQLKIVLLEDHETLGAKGQVVIVRPGFGRNFLIPTGVAVYGTPENIAKFAAPGSEETEGAEEDTPERQLRRFCERMQSRLDHIASSKDFWFNGGAATKVTKTEIFRRFVESERIECFFESQFRLPKNDKGKELTALTEFGQHVIEIDVAADPELAGLGMFPQITALQLPPFQFTITVYDPTDVKFNKNVLNPNTQNKLGKTRAAAKTVGRKKKAA